MLLISWNSFPSTPPPSMVSSPPPSFHFSALSRAVTLPFGSLLPQSHALGALELDSSLPALPGSLLTGKLPDNVSCPVPLTDLKDSHTCPLGQVRATFSSHHIQSVVVEGCPMAAWPTEASLFLLDWDSSSAQDLDPCPTSVLECQGLSLTCESPGSGAGAGRLMSRTKPEPRCNMLDGRESRGGQGMKGLAQPLTPYTSL